MLGLAACDQRRHAKGAQLAAVEILVVTTVSNNALRASLWRPRPAAYRRDRLDEPQQLGAVVAVGACERPGKRQPVAVS
jgi:hypothetical protein